MSATAGRRYRHGVHRIDAVVSWFRARPPWVADAVVALVVMQAELTVVNVLRSAGPLGDMQVSEPVAMLLVVAGTVPLVARRVAPGVVLAVVGAVAILEAHLSVPTVGMSLLIALYSVAAHRPRREALQTLGVVLLGTLVAVVL
jgi:hypothetical protein